MKNYKIFGKGLPKDVPDFYLEAIKYLDDRGKKY
jgi:hypothetical protein